MRVLIVEDEAKMAGLLRRGLGSSSHVGKNSRGIALRVADRLIRRKFVSRGDDSHPITGKALDEASAIALKATGGGTVTETEVGDEESYLPVRQLRA